MTDATRYAVYHTHYGRDLNDIMQMDHVIRVYDDGSVTDVDNEYAPSVYAEYDESGAEHVHVSTMVMRDRGGWQLERGWSGQWRYGGPAMHPSEFIGGKLADHILETPGLWVATTVTDMDDDSDENLSGWVVLHKEYESPENVKQSNPSEWSKMWNGG